MYTSDYKTVSNKHIDNKGNSNTTSNGYNTGLNLHAENSILVRVKPIRHNITASGYPINTLPQVTQCHILVQCVQCSNIGYSRTVNAKDTGTMTLYHNPNDPMHIIATLYRLYQSLATSMDTPSTSLLAMRYTP